ncbi:hypothetical protein ACFCX0_42420 [Streptomyces sp. NPDC056352]
MVRALSWHWTDTGALTTRAVLRRVAQDREHLLIEEGVRLFF